MFREMVLHSKTSLNTPLRVLPVTRSGYEVFLKPARTLLRGKTGMICACFFGHPLLILRCANMMVMHESAFRGRDVLTAAASAEWKRLLHYNKES